MQPDNDFPLNGLDDAFRMGIRKDMCLQMQREYVGIELMNAIRLETSFFNDRSGEFGLFQARAVDTGNSHRLTARIY